jgi:hypothetical protein
MKLKTTKHILTYLLKNGGITYNLLRGETANYRTGYFVSLKGYEKRLPKKTISAADISDYITDHLWTIASKRHFLGLWIDKSEVVFDVSVWVREYYKAISLGRSNHQKVIYDVKQTNVIYINS